MSEKLKVPGFATEAEEAAWWFQNQSLLADEFERAEAEGDLHRGLVARLARERSAAAASGMQPVTVRLSEEDLARARALAESKGMDYLLLLGSLLHEALSDTVGPSR